METRLMWELQIRCLDSVFDGFMIVLMVLVSFRDVLAVFLDGCFLL